MFYLEYILLIVIIISFFLHMQMNEITTFFMYNFSPIIFGFLSLHSIYKITNASDLYNIIGFIMNDDSGMSDFVILFLFVYVYCIISILVNFYVIHKNSHNEKETFFPKKK